MIGQKRDIAAAPSDAGLIDSAKAVLVAEGRALQNLSKSLDKNFAAAVHVIVGCKGRIIISGMGKAGHIARKVAATMASTGTPAIYVHPGEASHGDLGMVTLEDVVLVLSNSGETSELSDIVEYTRRFSIPLISITAHADSSLGKSSDIVLVLPPEVEAGSLGLAPTTSTTMMLALGDALAVVALESKGFTKEDFRNFHPGGKLGKILLRVSNIMHGKDALPLASINDPMSHVLVVMTEKSFGCAGIVDNNGVLVGIITDGDLRRKMTPDLLNKTAGEVMTKAPMTILPQKLAVEALQILNEKKRTNLFVVDNDSKPVGILHMHDLLRAGVI
ncbi:MAG: KpsF/GutQ family sugar-phosphate isomerase [Alphaproteobacteria bacterium]|nr:KpsF/GutQ family sugar-phosphate isomerase [Alphaproteobacteria bacterium]